MTDHKGELCVRQGVILACLFLVNMSGRPAVAKHFSGPQVSPPLGAQKQHASGAAQGKGSAASQELSCRPAAPGNDENLGAHASCVLGGDKRTPEACAPRHFRRR